LSPEAFEKIQALQKKHDSEIELLANELNLQPYFIKVLKYYINKNSKFNVFLIKFIYRVL
jgi:hypothetical protein